MQRTNNLEVSAPLSGTSLFADCWCIPAAAAGGCVSKCKFALSCDLCIGVLSVQRMHIATFDDRLVCGMLSPLQGRGWGGLPIAARLAGAWSAGGLRGSGAASCLCNLLFGLRRSQLSMQLAVWISAQPAD